MSAGELIGAPEVTSTSPPNAVPSAQRRGGVRHHHAIQRMMNTRFFELYGILCCGEQHCPERARHVIHRVINRRVSSETTSNALTRNTCQALAHHVTQLGMHPRVLSSYTASCCSVFASCDVFLAPSARPDPPASWS